MRIGALTKESFRIRGNVKPNGQETINLLKLLSLKFDSLGIFFLFIFTLGKCTRSVMNPSDFFLSSDLDARFTCARLQKRRMTLWTLGVLSIPWLVTRLIGYFDLKRIH